MADFKEHLVPYSLNPELEGDRTDENCFILDVGRDNDGDWVISSAHVAAIVESYRYNGVDLLSSITKLYIVGDWNTVLLKGKERAAEDNDKHVDYQQSKYSELEKEHHDAGEAIAELIEQMPGLKELTYVQHSQLFALSLMCSSWISGLPFMSVVWEELPTSLTKLVLDLGQPINVHHDVQQDRVIDYNYYITANEMKPLAHQTKLEELRLFRMQDSMQTSIWEAIFRNTSEDGMRVADLQMAAAPLVRSKHWHKAADVVGLTVPKADSKEKEYK